MVLFILSRSYKVFTNIKITKEENKFIGISCNINGLPAGIPSDLNNTEYKLILKEISLNGTSNFSEGETIPTELQNDVDAIEEAD